MGAIILSYKLNPLCAELNIKPSLQFSITPCIWSVLVKQFHIHACCFTSFPSSDFSRPSPPPSCYLAYTSWLDPCNRCYCTLLIWPIHLLCLIMISDDSDLKSNRLLRSMIEVFFVSIFPKHLFQKVSKLCVMLLAIFQDLLSYNTTLNALLLNSDLPDFSGCSEGLSCLG